MSELPLPSPLVAHRPGVWVKEWWVNFFGLTLQTRMIVFKLRDGLLLYSPGPATLDTVTRNELEALGPVRWLVAPNEIHNLGLEAFQAAYPHVHTTGSVGAARRVPQARFDVLLGVHSPRDAVPWTMTGELCFEVIAGNHFLHEIALFHAPTRTLVLADAVENIDGATLAGAWPGPVTRWFLSQVGLHLNTPCMSPEHVVFCNDPDALGASLAVIEGWSFDSLAISHGPLLDGEIARKAVHASFIANIERARRRGPVARMLFRLLARLVAARHL